MRIRFEFSLDSEILIGLRVSVGLIALGLAIMHLLDVIYVRGQLDRALRSPSAESPVGDRAGWYSDTWPSVFSQWIFLLVNQLAPKICDASLFARDEPVLSVRLL
jgi:hypothetical protein